MLDKFTLFTHFLVGWNLESLYKYAVSIFFPVRKLTFYVIQIRINFWQASVLQNRNWLRVPNVVYNTLRLVRISLLINVMNEESCFSSRESSFIEAIENFSYWVGIAWYKHSRGWENSR